MTPWFDRTLGTLGTPVTLGTLGTLLFKTREALDDVTDPRAVVEARSHRLPILAVVDHIETELPLAIHDFLYSAPQTQTMCSVCSFFRLKAEATGFRTVSVESEKIVGPWKRPDVCRQNA
jgi:hypothetical protein